MLEMGRFVAGSLTPWTVLLTHVVKLVCAGAILAADVVARVRSIDGRYTIIGMVLDGVFLWVPLASLPDARRARIADTDGRVTASALAVYATVTYRRLSAKFNHDYSFDIRGYGFSDDRERGGGYLQGRRGAARAGFEKHRALSVVSSRLSTASSNQGRLEVPHLMEPLDRRSSVYSHERDTQFDDYLARRTSADLKADLEGAIGAELGWGRPRRGSSPSSPPPEDIVLSVGTVGSRPRGASSPRAPSWVSDHVLLSVPEEEDDAAGAHEGREQREARAAEALLGGHGRRDSDDDGDVGAASPVPQGVDPVEPRWRRE